MLILSRRAGEAIIVDEKVTLTVLSIKGRQVRIGIDAPDDVSVHREEIFHRIKSGEDTGFDAATRKNGGKDQKKVTDSANEPPIEPPIEPRAEGTPEDSSSQQLKDNVGSPCESSSRESAPD